MHVVCMPYGLGSQAQVCHSTAAMERRKTQLMPVRSRPSHYKVKHSAWRPDRRRLPGFNISQRTWSTTHYDALG